MTISYPLALPSQGFADITVRQVTQAGESRSRFTGEQQVYVWPAGCWEAEVSYPPIRTRAIAEDIVGFLASLNGKQGSFLMGDPLYTTVRGTWLGSSPLVNGASQTGMALVVDAVGAAATVKRGDRFQLGTGASARLHMVTADGTANGSGEITLDIWPRLRESPADNAALTIAAPKGRWMLASNGFEYSVQRAQVYGLSFSVVEDLRPI